jgi:hypothetical protein
VESPHQIDKKDEFLKDLILYPENEDEILTTWEERACIWEEVDRNGAWRVMACDWAKSAYLFIDENNFDW